MGRDIKEDILKTLSEVGNNGATMREIEKKVSLERHTLSKYLSLLNKEGFLKYKAVGKAKVWFINRVPLETLFNSLPENRSFTERLLTDLITKIPIGVIVMDQDYNLLFMNERMTSKYGNIEGEKLYRSILRLENPLKLTAINQIIDNHTKSAEIQVVDRDGCILDIKASKMINPDRSFSIILLIDDITDRKMAEERLRASEEKYQDLVINAPIGYHSLGPDGKYMTINQTELDMLGCTKEELIGKKSLGDFVVPEDQHKWDMHWKNLIEKGRSEGAELAIYNKKQEKLYTRIFASVRKDMHGNFINTRAALIDITESKKAQMELMERTRQQKIVAELGLRALASADIDDFLNIACSTVCEMLNIELCRINELMEGEKELLIRAGTGWKEGVVGKQKLGAGSKSLGGFTLQSEEPVIMADFSKETRFEKPEIDFEHDVSSGVSVIIHGKEKHFGTLSAFSRNKRKFAKDDINFLQAVANITATAIEKGNNTLEIEKSRNQLDAILGGIQEGIIAVNTNKELIYANLAAANMLGFKSAEELLSLTRKELWEKVVVFDSALQQMTPEQVPTIKALEGETTGEILSCVKNKKYNTENWLLLKSSPVYDGNKNIIMAVDIIEDVTKRMELEQKLKESHRQLAELKFALDESSIVAVTDKDGIIIYANDKFCEISKYSREELIGKTHRVVNSGHHPKEFFKEMWDTIKSGKVWHGEIKNKAKDSSYYWLKSTIVPFLDKEGKPHQYIAVRTDITDIKKK
jgi:PAS domain S-box-containing protein